MTQTSIHFLLQLVVILFVIRIVGQIAKRVGQPQVVGEMIAGVLMGPSLLGLLFPSVQAWLFPPESKILIYTASQLGLIFYMFLVGTEFDIGLIQSRIRSAASVSIAGVATPFILGFGLAIWLAESVSGVLFTEGVAWHQAGLFMGAAMSITAFPMLARIILEKGLANTAMGTLVLAAGAIDDATAWCLMALVLAGMNNDPAFVITAVGGGVVYAVVTLGFVRPWLKRLAEPVEQAQTLSAGWFAFFLGVLLLGAWITDIIHIYAVFGAFIVGIAMPRGVVTRELRARLEPITQTLFLPLFFIYSGLNTKLSLLLDPSVLSITLIVIVVAVLGKGIACGLAAKLNGETTRDSAAIGVLMNARGLMELILLGIALEAGVITSTLFTIMVVMAVVTTLMASPLFEWVMAFGKGRQPAIPTPAPQQG